MKKIFKSSVLRSDDPMLDRVKVNFDESVDKSAYPFTLSIIKNLTDIEFKTPVTFFVGENGSGKSTILEAIAYLAGFNLEGGSVNMQFKTAGEGCYTSIEKLAEYLTLSWKRKPRDGYFFRAESFFNVASYIESIGVSGYGDKSLHHQSHGESFMAFFQNRLGSKGGFFIFDEPEASLSPQRQLSLLVMIHEMCKNSDAQFIIATHSPILLGYPNSKIYSCDSGTLEKISYTDTDHYMITKEFLNNPEQFLHRLFTDE